MSTNSLRRSLTLLVLAGLGTGACGSWQRVADTSTPAPEQSLMQMFDPGTLYGRLGRLVSTEGVPFIGTVVFVPGPGDSVRAVVGVSLSNRAFGFERAADAFVARYTVQYSFTGGGVPRLVTRDATVRVESMTEAQRTDETILLQQEIMLAPGAYQLSVRVSDRGTTRTGVASRAVTAPRFGPGSMTAPILAYAVVGRGARSDSINIVLNSRGTVAYGGDTLLIYIEGVGFRGPASYPLEVRDDQQRLVLRTNVRFTGAREIESEIVRIAPDSAPLGELRITLGDSASAVATSALVSFSGSWIVTNYDDLISLLRYFGEDNRLNRLRDADPEDRIELWREFYRATDPNSQTPDNEALDSYFARVALASTQFRDEGVSGWRTDRGEVFIALGPPDEFRDATPTQQGRYLQWAYTDLRLTLTFQDATGFGRYRLTPNSRADFERVRGRLQRGGAAGS